MKNVFLLSFSHSWNSHTKWTTHEASLLLLLHECKIFLTQLILTLCFACLGLGSWSSFCGASTIGEICWNFLNIALITWASFYKYLKWDINLNLFMNFCYTHLLSETHLSQTHILKPRQNARNGDHYGNLLN